MSQLLDLIAFWPILLALTGLFLPRRPLERLNLLGSGLVVLLAALSLREITEHPQGLLALSPLNGLLLALVSVIAFLGTIASVAFWQQHGCGDERRLGRYYLWWNLFVASLLLVVLANNLGLAWLAIEATTLTSGVLVAFFGDQRSVEAAWKYVVLCSVGLILALFGITLWYGVVTGPAAGGLAALNWDHLSLAARTAPPSVLRLAFVFLLLGLGTKAGLAPMHTWLPDAHSEAPAPVSGLLSGVLLAAVLTTLARAGHAIGAGTGPLFPDHLLLGFGLFSVALATPFLLLQRDLKRLLAYSSLEQIGLIAIGFGIGNRLALLGALLQLVLHAFIKSSLFFSAGRLTAHYRTKSLLRLRGVWRELPLTGALFLGGLSAIAGLPPFGLFVSEFLIILGGFQAHLGLAMAFLLLLLGLIFAGLWHYGTQILLGEGPERSPRPPRRLYLWASLVPLILSVLGVGLLPLLWSIPGWGVY